MFLLGLFFIAFFYGYRKGFVGQAVGVVGLVLSLLISYSFSQDVAVFLQKQFPLPKESSNPLIQAILECLHTPLGLYRSSFYGFTILNTFTM